MSGDTAILRVAIATCAVSLCACSFVEDLDQFDKGGTAPPAQNCGTFAHRGTSELQDDFSGSTFSNAWVPHVEMCQPELSGGDAVFDLAPNKNATGYCWLGTGETFHLTCDSVTLKVPGTTFAEAGPQTFIYITSETNDRLDVLLEGGGFEFAAPNAQYPTDRNYDSVADLWWRVRESEGQVYLDTAPDGQNWSTRAHGPDPFNLDAVYIQFGAGAHLAVPNPGVAKFDCYNLPSGCN